MNTATFVATVVLPATLLNNNAQGEIDPWFVLGTLVFLILCVAAIVWNEWRN